MPTRAASCFRLWGAISSLACVAWLVCTAPVSADTLDGVLAIRSAYVNVDRGVFDLHARVEYPVNPAIRDSLRDGVTLTFDLETKVERERRWWMNTTVVEIALRRELSYHAVSGRYIVRDVRSGTQENFSTLEGALEFLGTVDSWPILVEPQLGSGSYRISVRAGVRRGALPASLRAILFWTDDWHRVSEWYSWSLPV